MSLLKADQVRRELFVKYRRQIAAVLGETEDGDPIELCGCEETNNGGDDTKGKGNESCDEEEAQQQQQEEEEGDMEGMGLRLLERFRISYARQHLLRQRAMRMPDDYIKETTEGADDVKCASHSSQAADETTPCTEAAAAVAVSAGATEGDEVEMEGWRLVYNEPYPSIRRIMRRVQDESLQTLMRESCVPITAYRDAAYTAQRMAVLQQMEEQIGRERATLLARQQKMDGKLHPIE
ncbi:hypothetical protein C3747_53g14 [Trypanosoma cruzi]|uniref:Uncharacterized protein n=2 Tax=Trypanosoma cruzi TaxID=5693 RepID=Q4DYP0_TRYCC|nr:hypothetical protein, conserved [Trypanosoma cruzi]EAN97623.1 hypothetical protein, conserved [Trypanosoma cruzi]PWV12143.1 hypothetical protein C3747_53g14 [Trypanosoma cruzi]RNC50371.1 hypothetical protein TcCL_ESM12582 [Trypanosoma cruzi]|eukprot:XP_819474.1 hypothetical protein [Trypanosoma cruzi strain CL Brener]